MNILTATNLFLSFAQQIGDERQQAEGAILRALGIRTEDNRDNFARFFRRFIEPWVVKEITSGYIKPGQSWGVKLISKNNNISIVGTINDAKGKLSDNIFSQPSVVATKAIQNIKCPDFDKWLSEPQKYEG